MTKATPKKSKKKVVSDDSEEEDAVFSDSEEEVSTLSLLPLSYSLLTELISNRNLKRSRKPNPRARLARRTPIPRMRTSKLLAR